MLATEARTECSRPAEKVKFTDKAKLTSEPSSSESSRGERKPAREMGALVALRWICIKHGPNFSLRACFVLTPSAARAVERPEEEEFSGEKR